MKYHLSERKLLVKEVSDELYGKARPTEDPIRYDLAIGVGILLILSSLLYFFKDVQFHPQEAWRQAMEVWR